jgi:hypothetical protein
MCATFTKIMNFYLLLLLFKRDNSVKNQRTITKFELDLCIHMTNLYMQFESYSCIQTKVKEQKLKICIFSKFKRNNSVKNQWTMTKFEVDLRIPMTNVHMQFEPYTYIQTKFRERKLNFFFSREITLKSFWTATKFNLDLSNPVMYPCIKFE